MRINSINNTYNQNAGKASEVRDKNKSNPAFKGGENPKELTSFGNFYKGVADSKIFQSGIKAFSRFDNSFTHLLVIESTILSGFYMINTLRNKKIEEEQKPQMLINDTLTLGLSTAGAYLAEDKISDFINNKSEEYFKNNKDFYIDLGKKEAEKDGKKSPFALLMDKTIEAFNQKGDKTDEAAKMVGSDLKKIVGKPDKLKTFEITEDKLKQVQNCVKDTINLSQTKEEAQEGVKKLTQGLYESVGAREQADKTMSGIRKLKVLVVFGFIYRFVGPVAITPVANKLSSMFFPSDKEIAQQKAEAQKADKK